MLRAAAALSVFLAFAAAARADSGADWLGRYAPVSAACQGMVLVIVPHKLSFGNCSLVGFADLPANGGFAGHIDERARCALAGKVLTLTPDGPSGATLSTYDDEAAWRDGRPNLICAYSN